MSDLRPPVRYEPAPDGYHWAAVPDTGLTWRLDDTRRCRYMHDRRSCGKPSVAAMLRGTRRKTWWGYCAEHMFGRWVEDGMIMCWILRADDDGE